MNWHTFQTEVRPLFNMFAKNDLVPQHQLRCKEEWAYAILHGYMDAEMHQDFVTIVLTVCDFYLDPIYARTLHNIAEKTQGHFTSSSENNMSFDATILKNILPMTHDMHSKPNAKFGSVMATKHDGLQKYIVFTFGILIASTFTNKNIECTTYHKCAMLLLMGIDASVREQIWKLQMAQTYQDATRKDEIAIKLNRLFDFCIEGARKLIDIPFNSKNSAKILDDFLVQAMREYEGCL